MLLQHSSIGEKYSEIEVLKVTHKLQKPPYSPEDCSVCKKDVTTAEAVHRKEIWASVAMAHTLESLKSVGWSSFFAENAEVHGVNLGGDVNWKSTVWISREGGEIHAMRKNRVMW